MGGGASGKASATRWLRSSANFWIWRNLSAMPSRGCPRLLVTPRESSHGALAGMRWCLGALWAAGGGGADGTESGVDFTRRRALPSE